MEKERAAGHRGTGRASKTALETQGGHQGAKPTASRRLKRQRGRKGTPRPSPPEGPAEKPEAFRKTSPAGWLRCSPGAMPERLGRS